MASPRDIRLLLLDVDGVLTDGGLYMDDHGLQSKRFNVRDGLGIRLAQRAGLTIGFLTGKQSGIVRHRAAELGVELVAQGSSDKATDARLLAEKAGIPLAQTAHLGDDLIDLPAFGVVGYPMAVVNAVPEVKAAAKWTGTIPGGEGAAREAIEFILKEQGKWGEVIAKYQAGAVRDGQG